MKNFIQPGKVMEFVAAAAIASGQVVAVGSVLGVSKTAVASGATGELLLEGVYKVPKVAGNAITAGAKLLWDSSAAAFDIGTATAAAGDITGDGVFAFAPAAAGDTSMLVKFTGVPGTVA